MGKYWTDHHAVIFGDDSPPTIRKGSKGDIVKEWQHILGIPEDGDFGKGTKRATQEWQTAHGLTPDGIVGPQVWAKAHQLIYQSGGSNPATATDPTSLQPTTTSEGTTAPIEVTTIRKGSSGETVKRWQGFLKLPTDGVFGPGTDRVTRAWQRRNGLKPDGVVGPKTWELAMGGKPIASTDESVPAVNPSPVTPPSTPAEQQAAPIPYSWKKPEGGSSPWLWGIPAALVAVVFGGTVLMKGKHA